MALCFSGSESKRFDSIIRKVVLPEPKGASRLTTRAPSTKRCSVMMNARRRSANDFRESLSKSSKVTGLGISGFYQALHGSATQPTTQTRCTKDRGTGKNGKGLGRTSPVDSLKNQAFQPSCPVRSLGAAMLAWRNSSKSDFAATCAATCSHRAKSGSIPCHSEQAISRLSPTFSALHQ